MQLQRETAIPCFKGWRPMVEARGVEPHIFSLKNIAILRVLIFRLQFCLQFVEIFINAIGKFIFFTGKCV